MPDAPIAAGDFAEYFAALWGREPFPWQQALADRLTASPESADADNDWPPAITPPTAGGKTACLDIAVFALAAQAHWQQRGWPRRAPRRVFLVVDRRVIVDEAFDRARLLASRLQAAGDGVLGRVAAALRELAGGPHEAPLACFQLRGGVYRDDGWARSPIQPTIVCATVDQIGSRLLYRAYGRSFKAWPLQAGLVGNDSLIILDEAHCAEPFRQTLTAVQRYRTWAESPSTTPFRVVLMTATPPAGMERFPDEVTAAADRAHPVLRRRIEASKPCRLVVASKASGRTAEDVNKATAARLVAETLELLRRSSPVAACDADQSHLPLDLEASRSAKAAPAVAVFCNRVDTARRVYAALQERADLDSMLFTGRMRPLDRDDVLAGPLQELHVDRAEQRRLARPLVVVATQTLEVGANLDFDLMVSECADLPALRQRFGRLNRLGRPVAARGVIVVRADQSNIDTPPDPVYGSALARTWDWLRHHAVEHDEIDLGIAAFDCWAPGDSGELTAAPRHAPVLLPAHLDALVQTAPQPQPSPDIALFLHGPDSGPADVQVCWRADLPFDPDDPGRIDAAAWIEAIAACPPAAGELMPVPFGVARRWLRGLSSTNDGGDVEGVAVDEAHERKDGEVPHDRLLPRALRWRGPLDDATALVDDADSLRPGDLLVVPVACEGWSDLGHRPAGTLADLGDRANVVARGKAVLRLHPELVAQWPAAPTDMHPPATGGAADHDATLESIKERLASFLQTVRLRSEEDPAEVQADLRALLVDLERDPAAPGWLRAVACALARDRTLAREGQAFYGENGIVLRASGRLPGFGQATSDFTHEDDATASGSVSRPVPLDVHLAGVRKFAARFSGDLPPTLSSDVQLAAAMHDLGKADPRFQALLRGGNRWLTGELLAKSGDLPKSPAGFRRAAAAAGYPEHCRHELLSVRLIESVPALLQGANDPELVLHLVASHHGHGRPFAPIVDDAQPLTVAYVHEGHALRASTDTGLERIDSGIAERFWRLVRRYGWWGIAGLEAMMILADHRRSEWEELHVEGDGR